MDRAVRSLLLFFCVAFNCECALVTARAEEVSISKVTIGIEGHARQGHWTELRFTCTPPLEPGNYRLEVRSRDGDGAPVSYQEKWQVTHTSASQGVISFKVGPPRSPISLHIYQDDMLLATHEQSTLYAHRSTSELIGLIGDHDVGLTNAVEKMRRSASRELAVVELTSTAQLPETLRGYDCLSRLCVVVGKKNPLQQATATQQAAFWSWLQNGGRLIFVVAPGGSAHFTAENLWTHEQSGRKLAPGTWGEERALQNEMGIQAFTGEPLPFELAKIENKPGVAMLQGVPRECVLQWEAGSSNHDVPLVVESPYGFGTTSWILLDISHPRLTEWAGLPRLWERVFYGRNDAKEEQQTVVQRGQVTHRGYQDLAGQLRMALDQYEQVAPIHFYGVAGVILAYLCLLGPGEYFALRRFLPSFMHMTWYVLPLLVGGMVSGGIWLGQNTRGHVVRLNQAELLDIDVTAGEFRGQYWAGLFTPQARMFSFTAQPTLAQPLQPTLTEQSLAWQVLPGGGLGGVDAPALASGVSQAYELQHASHALPQLLKLSIPAASSKLLHGRWQGKLADVEHASELRRGKTRDLEGTFKNLSPWTLSSAYLAHGDWMYRATDELQPGATVHVERMTRKHLEFQLTKRNVLASSDLATPWNADDTDVARILEIMQFHHAVGRENYTVLTNHYYSDLDLSRLLKQGHAILVGKVATPLVELQEEGTPIASGTTRRWSWVRILYPVQTHAVASQESESK